MRIEDYFIWQNKEGSYCSVNYDYRTRRLRQSIEPRYLENGSIYVFSPELIRNERNRLGGKIAIYEMPFWKSFQVDDRDDLEICEYYIRKKLLTESGRDAG
jgi:N-acylneuraminate cytidylyltransferase